MLKNVIISIVLHAVLFSFLFVSVLQHEVKPVIKVNLRKDPGKSKIVKARIVDKKAIDHALQRQEMLERQKRDELLAQQRQAEERLAQAQAIEAAKKLAQEKLQFEQQQQKIVQQAKKEKELAQKKLQQQKLEQQQLQKQKLEQQKLTQQKLVQQQTAAKQEAALKAEKDKLALEHQEFLLTEVEKYRAAFQELIEDNRILSAVFPTNINCKIRIKLLPDGSVLSVNIVQASGNPAYDELATTAIYKSAPFPMPQEHELYNQLRDIILSFKNGDHTADVL